MKSFLACCLIGLALIGGALITTQIVTADIARPKASPKKQRIALHTGMVIQPDAKAYEARLLISESHLKSLTASLNGSTDEPAFGATIGNHPTRTIIAGVLLFLSISLAGVWIARSGVRFGKRQKMAGAAILVVATIGLAAIATHGNAGPPGYVRWRNLPQRLANGEATAADVTIEIVADDETGGNDVKLIIPLRKTNSGEE